MPSPNSDISARLLSLVQDGDRLFIGTGAGEPRTLIHSLVEDVLPRRKNIELVQVSVGGSEAITTVDRRHGHRVRLIAGGRLGNAALGTGDAELMPASMGTLARMIADGSLPVSGTLVAGVRSADGSAVSPGLSLDLGPAAAHAARFRALELNAALPRTRAADWLRESDCELVAETDEPPPTMERGTVNETQRAIGVHVARLVPSGSTVELGIGQGLRGVAAALAGRESGFRISLHTGLITDDVRDLVEAGIVAGPACRTRQAPVVATVACGSADFYRWLSDNPSVHLVDSSEAHQTRHLMNIGRFMAINSASQIDLLGQVGSRTRSGAVGGGGLPDFATAGAHSAGSVIALESRTRHGTSRIVARLPFPQLHASSVTHIVTEYGAAELRGATAAERAERIIAVAHPADRDGLRTALAEADRRQEV
ncbi:acetyl-CoA hydrolase/transferase C-terminal domain-containing protein [Streptomyces chartreusis]